MLSISTSPFLNDASEAWHPKALEQVLSEHNTPNLIGKIVVMNQGTEGDFSEETSKRLMELGAKVYIFDQHMLKRQGVSEKDYGDHCLIECDMNNLESVQHAALIFLAIEDELHYLFLNGQVTNPWEHEFFGVDKETRQGHEHHMGINVLAQHLLVRLLKPALLKTASISQEETSRIIFTTPQKIHLDPSELSHHSDKPWDPNDEASLQYSHHKKCIRSRLAFYHEAMIEAEKFSGSGVVVTLVPPVDDPSNHYCRHAVPYWTGKLNSLLWPSHTLSLLQTHAALSPIENLDEIRLAAPWSHHDSRTLSCSASPDIVKALKTWQWCEEKTRRYQTNEMDEESSDPAKEGISL